MDRRDTILIADDMDVNRAILRTVFESSYNVLEAKDGGQTITLLEQYHDRLAVMLLDLIMPVKDGYQVMKEMNHRGFLKEIPVVVITAESSVDTEIQAFDYGASDIVMKPFETTVVRRRVQNIIDLNLHKLNQNELISEQSDKLRKMNSIMISTLSSVIESRSIETGQHVQRMCLYTKVLLQDVMRCYPEYLLDDHKVELISSAASMHDIGKIAVPDAVLNKPGRLTDEEYEIMKSHTVRGCEILSKLTGMNDTEYLEYAYNICRYHHERWDGRGYPDHLKGESIPICAQVVGVADCFDALATDRVYRAALEPDRAINMILNGECGMFSPKLLESLKNVQATFIKLSCELADNMELPEELKIELPSAPPAMPQASDTLRQGQMKYFTLLKYMNETVMEADLNTGLYHMVYIAGGEFEPLRAGNNFADSIRHFIQESVHPDDRQEALRLLTDYADDMFAEGIMRKQRRYRLADKLTGVYYDCEETIMRVGTDSAQHKALFIWRRQSDTGDCRTKVGTIRETMLKNVIVDVQLCRNDKWFTMPKVSDGLLALLGYTEAEVAELFHNRYIDLVYSDDRPEMQKHTEEQQYRGAVSELEYRVVAKNGRVFWLLDKSQLMLDENGDECLYCVLIDITQSKKVQEELQALMERYQIIMEQTNDIIFEWDAKKDTLSCSSNWHEKFGFEPPCTDVSVSLQNAPYIYPEDQPKLTKLVEQISKGMHYGVTELRIADITGRYLWCRLRVTSQLDRKGKIDKAVGVLSDIDMECRASQELRDKAERDSLTKLLNKGASSQQIESSLRQMTDGQMGALLLIDIDDFKNINDTYGHMFGDLVLQKIASSLQRMFRAEDVVARIGGDEFQIFMRDIPSLSIAKDRAAKINTTISHLSLNDVENFSPTCSIGIASYPADGGSFHELFKNSDLALYHAKSHGKSSFTVFDASMTKNPKFDMQPPSAATTTIDSEHLSPDEEEPLTSYFFTKLCEHKNADELIGSILTVLGRRYGVSRAGIFESSCDGTYCVNTYEWCDEGISSQKEKLSHVAYFMDGVDLRKQFDEKGFFSCTDISVLPEWERSFLEMRDTKSFLLCAMYEGDLLRGYIGFDDCRIHRVWIREQIQTIFLVAKLMQMLLNEKMNKDLIRSYTESLGVALNDCGSWVYSVDPADYRLLYCNPTLREAIPQAKRGLVCYETLYGFASPCKGCPLFAADGKAADGKVEVSDKASAVTVHAVPIGAKNGSTFVLTRRV